MRNGPANRQSTNSALQLFQAVQTSILPHLTTLRATGETDPFRRSVQVTVRTATLADAAASSVQIRRCVAPLRHQDEVVGMAVRTRDGTQPVYASVGNHIDLPSAARVILDSARGYRIPEPTRQAHLHVNVLRRQGLD